MNEPPAIRPREIVILATRPADLAAWYETALGFRVTARFPELDYVNLETAGGVRIGIGGAPEDGLDARSRPPDRIAPQLETDDVEVLLRRVHAHGGEVDGPHRDAAKGFHFGSFKDPDGHAWWVVDPACP